VGIFHAVKIAMEGTMWSIFFMIIIVACAAYSVYRHLKKEIAGDCSGGCAHCAARRSCQPQNKEKNNSAVHS
jgi:hypothetical protein